jgi:hypothetical protein
MPVYLTGNVYVISFTPSNMCFFCNGAGIESIVELNTKEDSRKSFMKLKTDDYIEVKGRLRLNTDDYEHAIYIMMKLICRLIKYK